MRDRDREGKTEAGGGETKASGRDTTHEGSIKVRKRGCVIAWLL